MHRARAGVGGWTLLAAVSLLLPSAVEGQQPLGPSCTYDSCALSLQTSWTGVVRVVSGRDALDLFDGDGHSFWAISLDAAGIALYLVGSPILRTQGMNELSRAVWWYTRELPR